MKFSAALKACQAVIASKHVPFLSGGPGVGKTAIARMIADIMKGIFVPVDVSLYDSVDFGGQPFADAAAGRAYRLPYDDLLPSNPDFHGVVMLDDITYAPLLTQAAVLRLPLERRCGPYIAPDGAVFIAGGNRPEDGGGFQKSGAAFESRFVWIDVEADLDETCTYLLDHDGPEIAGFLRFKSDLLYTYDPIKKPRSFGSPRSWARTADIIKSGLDDDVRYHVLAGSVGQGEATELVAFLKMQEKAPSIDQIFLDPHGTPVPTEASIKYAVAASLAYRANVKNFEAVLIYAKRMPREFQALTIRDSLKRTKALANTPAYTRWAADPANSVFNI